MDRLKPVRHTARPAATAHSARDQAVIELVARFRQLERRQIGVLLFDGLASQTPLDRALKRLVAGQYLARIRRLVGGEGGGSSQYVYQLGRRGWRLAGKPGSYRPFRSVSLHTLAIAECFVQLRELERCGKLALLAFEPDPTCHQTVGDVLLTPDAYCEVGFRERGLLFQLWLEVDRDTENANEIKGKCVRYWRAYQHWPHDSYPYVLFVVPDEQRAREIKCVIVGGPNEAQELFLIATFASFPQAVAGMYKSEVGKH